MLKTILYFTVLSTLALVFSACPSQESDQNLDSGPAHQLKSDGGVTEKFFCEEAAKDQQKVFLGQAGLDFQEFVDKQELNSWLRPQGGVGSRVNIMVSGFKPDLETDGIHNVEYIEHIVLFKDLDVFSSQELPNADHNCSANPCQEQNECYKEKCHSVVARQNNGRFVFKKAMFCLEGGNLHVPDVPLAFKRIGDADADADFYDSKEVYYFLRLHRLDGTFIDSKAEELVIKIGEWTKPYWWDMNPIVGEEEEEDNK